MTKRLRELNPRMEGDYDEGVLLFNCPSGNGVHRIRIELGGIMGWQASGNYPDHITLVQAVKCGLKTCGWKGRLIDGSLQ